MAIVNSRAAIEPKTGKAAIFVNETIHSLMRKLFSNGEQGFFYDPNDLSTMYQDAGGTIPVTAAGQPVGLVLDKSKGLVLGSELWANQTPSIQNTSGTIGAYNSTTRTMTNTGTDAAGYPRFVFNVGAIVGKRYFISGKLSGNISEIDSFAKIRLGSGGNTASLFYNSQTGEFYGRVLAESDSLQFITNLSVGESLTLDSISVKELAGNHAYQTTSASRPILRQNAVTGANYLEFDGSDDFLVTNSINFTGTDKVSLFAGVRKLSDATFRVVTEFSGSTDTNNGTFFLVAPRNNTLGNFGFRSKGTSNGDVTSPSSYISPHSAVLNGVGNISQDSSILRINGLQVGTGITDQGTGNYGNYPLYIGRRGGTSLPFNGHIYSLIGIGRLTTDSETIALEKSIAKNTGVTLSV